MVTAKAPKVLEASQTHQLFPILERDEGNDTADDNQHSNEKDDENSDGGIKLIETGGTVCTRVTPTRTGQALESSFGDKNIKCRMLYQNQPMRSDRASSFQTSSYDTKKTIVVCNITTKDAATTSNYIERLYLSGFR